MQVRGMLQLRSSLRHDALCTGLTDCEPGEALQCPGGAGQQAMRCRGDLKEDHLIEDKAIRPDIKALCPRM